MTKRGGLTFADGGPTPFPSSFPLQLTDSTNGIGGFYELHEQNYR